jgi:uncharacterized membrane protein YjgN (DUF898 family)
MNSPSTAEQRPRSGLDRELEDGPLREALGLPRLQESDAAAEPPTFETRLRFTGTGSEYYGIWVVNTLLTVLTLGIYSAWAKQRKARWFAQHTLLMDDRFDYHGQPLRILAGRAIALVLLALYSYGFLVTPKLGWTVLIALIVAGPVLFTSAQRFRLVNTSWRGLRFDFQPPIRRVYAVCVPLIMLWLLGTALSALGASATWIVAGTVLVLLCFPLAHARLKQLQHAYASLGDTQFRFTAAAADFYGLYALGAFFIILLAIAAMVVAAMVASIHTPSSNDTGANVVLGAFTGALIWLCVWPYFAARMQQIVWSHTQWGVISFKGEMDALSLWKLTLGQMLLVGLTAGLYWPFAAVAIARYRIECISLVAHEPLREIVAQAPAAASPALGDASADFFGLDLGW